MNVKTYKLIIMGRVQGVGFRYFTRELAAHFSITGWVKNVSNGNVEALLQGHDSIINQMIEKLYEGPAFGNVEMIDKKEINTAKRHHIFEIIY
jgi:acylphosphatase